MEPQVVSAFTAETDDQRTTAWLAAKHRGFLLEPPTPAQTLAYAASYAADVRRLAYVSDERGRIVATAAGFAKALTVRPGHTVTAWLVADVTVLPAWRGRGLLHALMAHQAEAARGQGAAVQALYAADATLYGATGSRRPREVARWRFRPPGSGWPSRPPGRW